MVLDVCVVHVHVEAGGGCQGSSSITLIIILVDVCVCARVCHVMCVPFSVPCTHLCRGSLAGSGHSGMLGVPLHCSYFKLESLFTVSGAFRTPLILPPWD